MSAIERCRTAALGGHVARCENAACGHTLISYNSCLMGKFRNGELTDDYTGLSRILEAFALHYEPSLVWTLSLSGHQSGLRTNVPATKAAMDLRAILYCRFR